LKKVIFVVTLALLAVLAVMFVFGIVTDREAFAPEVTTDTEFGITPPPTPTGSISPDKASPPASASDSTGSQDAAPPAQETAGIVGEKHTITFPSSGVTVSVYIDGDRYEEMSEGYMFVDTSVPDNAVMLEFTFLDPTYGSSVELAPGFLTPYLDDAETYDDYGISSIGESGVKGNAVSASNGSLTYRAWLVDVPGGTLPVVISYYSDEQYSSLIQILNTLLIINE
jgi:hypothetical protein